MPRAKRYARIAITLPEPELAVADRLARAQDRSRSWIVAEAIRRYAAATDSTPDPSASGADADRARSKATGVREGLGPSRLAQLVNDLKLTPEQRVWAAEETLGQAGASRARRHHVLAFDRYEDFLGWKRNRNAGG